MRDVTQYRILTSATTKGLEAKVNDHIEDGWFPHGSFFKAAGKFTQAMLTTLREHGRIDYDLDEL